MRQGTLIEHLHSTRRCSDGCLPASELSSATRSAEGLGGFSDLRYKIACIKPQVYTEHGAHSTEHRRIEASYTSTAVYAHTETTCTRTVV